MDKTILCMDSIKGDGKAFTMTWTPEKFEKMKKLGYIFIDPEIKQINRKEDR